MKIQEKIIIKTLAITFLALFTLTFSSCKKDPPKTDKCCQFEGTITGYPQGCLPMNDNHLVIFDGSNYFAVADDLTGKFHGLKKGDKVCFDYVLSEPCNIRFVAGVQGIAQVPVGCIKLTCLTKRMTKEECDCGGNKTCIPQKDITYQQFTKKYDTPYQILEGKVIGDKIHLKVGYSGCQREDMEFQVALAPTMGPFPVYYGVLEYPKTMCQMYIVEDMCIDISDFPNMSHIGIKDSHGTKVYEKK